MFGRKRPEGDTPKRAPDALEELQLPAKPGARPAPAAATVPPRPPVIPPRAPSEPLRPIGDPARRAEAAAPPAATPTPSPGLPSRREAELRKLIVGREISLAGEITSCDRLVVEGSVEANLANCRDIEISDTGVYKGSASIEEAEIRGPVRYGQIEIECGGQISGDVQAQPTTSELPPSLVETRPLIETPRETDLVE
jgi:cytoskeletal protein CcmA (bactofilin family)